MANVRECAMKVIYEVEYNGAYSNLALKKALPSYSPEDRAFCTSLVYGVIDRKLTLDYIIASASRLKLKKISKYILTILRMGVYQIKFMDKIPVSAAVNESVKLAKRYGHGASAGFVNGVLRSAACTDTPYPDNEREYLSVKYSVPLSLCHRWIDEFGYDFTEKMLEAFAQNPPLLLRPNTLKTDKNALCQELNKRGTAARVHGGYVETEGFDISHDELYRNGMYSVQDAAAMEAAIALAPKKGDTVIDMCAAPGGKTTHLAELMQNEGKIYAFDVHEHKIELIRKNAARLGITIIEPNIGDGRVFTPDFEERADKILCDVPCSGLGIIRRKPEIKYRNADNEGLPELQGEILANAARYLKKGGEIVYSTCTIEKAENEGVTGAFLENHSDFERLTEKTYYPHTDNTDGFYICKMRRTG